MTTANDTDRAYQNGLRDGRAELERWKTAAGEYYQAKENHRATLEEIRRHLNDPALSDTAKVIRAQGALTGKVRAQEGKATDGR